MTDVLDRDGAAPSAAEIREIVERRADLDLTGAARLLLAAVAAGAGAIHLAMVPSHWGESAVEGMGFAVSGWLQVAFAVAVVTRPSRWLLRLGIVLSAAAIGAWIVSRTAGLPFGAHSGHAETAGFLDVTCVAFEAALILAAAVLLFRPRVDARFARGGFGVAVVASIGVLALTTGALASPGARNHAAGSHGDHGAAAMGDGHAHDDAAAAATDDHAHDASDAAVDDKGLSLLSNGHHAHIQLSELDQPTQKALDAQLAVTRGVALLTPTVADAEAAGYKRVGPYFPGIGAHYWKGVGADVLSGPRWNPDGLVDDVDLREPLMLIFDGTEQTSNIAGFMYYSAARTEPTGFEGRNDFWHFHESLCLKMGADGTIDVPYGLDHQATQAQCDKVGGRMIEASQYMVHVWSVPGFEMTDEYGGVFGEVNPKLDCADGSYYQFPVEEWIDHPLNVCKAQ